MQLAVESQKRNCLERAPRKKNPHLEPKFLATEPLRNPLVRWFSNALDKYDVKRDRHFMQCRKKGGGVPIGDGRYTYVPPRCRNIRKEREKALFVIRKICCSFVNTFPFEDSHAPLEVEISVKQMAKFGNMYREYAPDYNGTGVYRHGREAMDIAYNAIKDLVLAGYAIPLTSHVEEGEKKGHYKPVRLFLTRDFFESMGVSFDELRRRQAKYRDKLKEEGKWDKECHKQAMKLAKRLKKADLTQMTITERERLIAQIDRCRRYCKNNVLPLEEVRSKITRQNTKARKAGEVRRDPAGVLDLMDKLSVFDPDMEKRLLRQKKIKSLVTQIRLTIEEKNILPGEVKRLEKLAEEEVAILTETAFDQESKELRDLEQHAVLLELVKNWSFDDFKGDYRPPS